MTENGKAGRFGVKYNENRYNIYEFLKRHPGGVNYVKPFEEKDISQTMSHHEHSKAAYYLLKEYKDGGRSTDSSGEDLEHLVDWDKPILFQLASLGPKYKEWVFSPVDREIRLFGNPILENMTRTPWYAVPLVWIPFVLYFVSVGTEKYTEITKDPVPVIPVVLYLALGVCLWQFMEYSVHRWVFHIEPSGDSKFMIYFHFAIHGLHHKVPFDTGRLVFPPLPALVIAVIVHAILSFIFPESTKFLVLAGMGLGYAVYDMIHYYLHHGAPKENTYFYHLKRYHNDHHFVHDDNAFGISSTFWDKIFGTTISLRKLKLGIKW